MVKIHLFWSLIRNLGIRLGSVIVFFILARILPPEQLGWFAAALVIFNFAEIFSDSGVGDAIAQRKHLTEKVLNTALLINVGVGVFIFLILFVFSSEIASLINAPESAVLLKYTSFGLVLNSMGYAAQAYYRHHMEFKWLAQRAFISMLIGAVTGILLALNGAGVWAFVGQFLISALTNVILAWVKVPWPPKLQYASEEAKQLFGFGKNIISAKVLDFTANRSLELFIIAIFGPATLAIYVMGQKIYSVVMQLLAAVTIDVMLPSFAKLQDNPEKLRAHYFRAFETTLMIASPLFIILALVAPHLIPLIFGSNGEGAAPILSAFALLGSVQVVSYLNSAALNAMDKPHIPMITSALKALFTLALMGAFNGFELLDLIHTYALLSASTALVGFYCVATSLHISWQTYLISFGRFSVCLGAMLGAYWLTHATALTNQLFNTFLLGSSALLAYSTSLAVVHTKVIKQLISRDL